MVWTQTIETDAVDDFSDLSQLIASLQTNGSIEAVSLEITADSPIHSLPNIFDPATESTETPDPATSSDIPDKTATADTADETATNNELPPVTARKWPRLCYEVDDVDETVGDLPLSAAAYPGATHDFHGNTAAKVDHDTAYRARVNGIGEKNGSAYGVFVTLTGTGYESTYYDDVTGLVHETNLLQGDPRTDYNQGDTIIVELVAHTDKGLGFRELPLVSTDQAHHLRDRELDRLSALHVAEGDTIEFSKWPETKERQGNIISINQGEDTPPRPPSLKVQTSGATHTIHPSEVVADSHPIDRQRPITDTIDKSDKLATTTTDTDTDTDTTATTDSPDGPITGPSASPLSAGPNDTPTTRTDDETDTADESETAIVCECGETFEKEKQLYGHQRWCDDYKDTQSTDDEDEDAIEATTITADGGTVLNPLLINPSYKYGKVAILLYLADDDRLTARGLTEIAAETEWDMSYGGIQTHLKTLREKDAVAREDKGSYEYWLTDRAVAGVEQAIDELPDGEIPAV